MSIARYIDYTLLKATGTVADVKRMCREAMQYNFAAVCVHTGFVKLCAQLLAESGVGVATVVGFPFGADKPEIKAMAAELAVADGATEIDMVMNIGHMLSGNTAAVKDDIATVVEAVRGRALVKVIIETAYLSREQIVLASKLVQEAGADFVKTSTGFAPSGAKVEDIALIRQTVGPDLGIKASGGISDYQTAKKMLDAGATRLGASAGVAIAEGEPK